MRVVQNPTTGVETYLDLDDPTWPDLDESLWTTSAHLTPLAIPTFCFFVILCAFVMLSLVIAVILDNPVWPEREVPVSKGLVGVHRGVAGTGPLRHVLHS